MNGFIMFPVMDCDRVRIPYQDALIITVSVKRFYLVETTWQVRLTTSTHKD